jgi:hypothetical protein
MIDLPVKKPFCSKYFGAHNATMLEGFHLQCFVSFEGLVVKQIEFEYIVDISRYSGLGVSENVVSRIQHFARPSHLWRRMENVVFLVNNCITERIRTEKNGVYLITLDFSKWYETVRSL